MASWEEFSRIVAEAKAAKKLDPVGHEDDDVDNDGDSDSSDSYLKKRRATIGAAIAADRKKKVEESYDDLDEAKVDEKLPEHERATARDKRSGHNLPGSGTRRVRRAEHEERRGKPKRWWDDDGDGIGWEKGEVKKESVEQIDEIAPLVAGGIAAAAAAPYLAKKFLSKPINKALDNATKTNKLPLATGGNMQQLRQAQNNSYQPEGGMVEEDKEYRREMAKAAARERAEEKKEKGKKAAKIPGRLGISSGTSYADKQELSIKGHDKVTKKAKHTVGNPFPEEYAVDGEYIEEMPYQVYGSHDGKTEKKIGKPVKSRKYAHDRADELSDTHKETGGKFRVQKEENDLDEGMTMKDFKQQRSRQKQKDKRETEKTSPLRRAGIHDDKASPERAARHRANVDPDFEGNDERNYPGGKLRPNKVRKAKALGELGEGYLEEKSLSRAQQRFMGMVYAAKKGETPASPEVAKAASGMSKKAARDFAKTKHEGLPEKKEEVKEELSLVQRIIAEATDAQWMAAKARRDEREKEQRRRMKQAKLNTAAVKAMKDESERNENNRDESKSKRGKSALTGAERAEAIRTAGRVKTAKIYQQIEREKRLEKKEREKRESEEEKKKTKKRQRRELRSDIKSALSSPIKVSASEKDTDVASAVMSNVGSLAGSVAKVGGALAKYGVKRALTKRQERKESQSKEKETQKEQFSNWREEFIFEVDDQSVKNEKQKVIDVSKKKNKIEINPNMSEGCGCDEKEKEETPKKDMRDLPTKVNLLKTKARAMGARNPIVMVASEETDIDEGMTLKDFKANRKKNERRAASADAEKRGHVGKEWHNTGRKYSPDEAKSNRAKLSDDDRAARHRVAVDPDDDSDENTYSADRTKNPKKLRKQTAMGESAAWTKKEGKSESGGLNEKGRRSYEAENPGSDLKAPSKKVGNPRRASFCSRMKGMKEKLTSAKTANDPDSRINKSLRAWNC